MIKIRYALSKQIYIFLSECCIKNPENQEYLIGFLEIYINHIDYGKFVIDFLETVLQDNPKILESLNSLYFYTKKFDKCEKNSLIHLLLAKIIESNISQKCALLNLLEKICYDGK